MNNCYDCFCTCSVFCTFPLKDFNLVEHYFFLAVSLLYYYFYSLLKYFAEERLQGEIKIFR
jgi:hypothetical protein